MTGFPADGDALDVLDYEDQVVRRLLDRFQAPDDQLTHGVVGKLLVRHLAVREAAKEMVTDALEASPRRGQLAMELQQETLARRDMIAHLDEMAHGVKPMDLNEGQDFDAAVEPLRQLLDSEIRRELDEVLPALRDELDAGERKYLFPRATYVRRHAPSHPNPRTRHRYERLGPLAWFHAWYDSLREYPTGESWARSKLSELLDQPD